MYWAHCQGWGWSWEHYRPYQPQAMSTKPWGERQVSLACLEGAGSGRGGGGVLVTLRACLCCQPTLHPVQLQPLLPSPTEVRKATDPSPSHLPPAQTACADP